MFNIPGITSTPVKEGESVTDAAERVLHEDTFVAPPMNVSGDHGERDPEDPLVMQIQNGYAEIGSMIDDVEATRNGREQTNHGVIAAERALMKAQEARHSKDKDLEQMVLEAEKSIDRQVAKLEALKSHLRDLVRSK